LKKGKDPKNHLSEEEVNFILKKIKISLLRTKEILGFSDLLDYNQGIQEFRLRLSLQSGGTITEDSTEEGENV
jgi:hypothetical protein